MPLLKAEADKLSNNQLVAGIIEEIIERDDLFAVLPFMRVNSKAYVYNREDTGANNNVTQGAGMPTFLDPNDTVVEGAVPFKEVTTRLRIIAGDVDVDNFLQEVESDTNDQMAIQIAQKAKALGRVYHDALVNGNSSTNPKAFDGVTRLMTNADSNATMTINAAANGAALTLGMLDQLLDTVKNGADALIMRRGTARAFRALVRQAGGITAEDYALAKDFGRPMLSHNGVPILINDFMPANETLGSGTNLCSVYAVRLNEMDGLHGLYGGDAAGIRVEDIGTVQNKDAQRLRVKWYCGLALKSTQSLARLQGVSNT
ncbi:major capsid protein [Methyloversatilis sp.]|uniref:major capsid protein n=1 Tax=Methyloversatilis sp. TaxID=2569862 RepID=UPI0035B0322A